MINNTINLLNWSPYQFLTITNSDAEIQILCAGTGMNEEALRSYLAREYFEKVDPLLNKAMIQAERMQQAEIGKITEFDTIVSRLKACPCNKQPELNNECLTNTTKIFEFSGISYFLPVETYIAALESYSRNWKSRVQAWGKSISELINTGSIEPGDLESFELMTALFSIRITVLNHAYEKSFSEMDTFEHLLNPNK